MNIFVYSDESGVFDKIHNEYFVFGGLIFLDKESRDICARKYSKAENDVKRSNKMDENQEAKASALSNKYKAKLYRSLNNVIRFGVVIEQEKVNDNIWNAKKSKQRYLDYAYKIAVKRCFEHLIREGRITPQEVENIYFFVDEHTTATNGTYELLQSLEQEFKYGIFNPDWAKFYPPIFPTVKTVTLKYCNSCQNTLVRAADVVANRIFYNARIDPDYKSSANNLYVIRLP